LKESTIEKEMRDYLRYKGFITIKGNSTGMSDIIAFGKLNNKATTIFIEVKTPRGRPSKAQLLIKDKIKALGFEHYYILDNLWDLKEILEG
jgi:Holliday junction resolvase